MSNLYSENNREGAKNLFNKRLNYTKLLRSYGKRNIVDFDFGERMFYGRMDMEQRAITLIEQNKALSSLPSTKGATTPKRALAFVTEAFKMLQAEIAKAAASGKIRSNDQYLSSLKVHRAYESPKNKYDQYLKIYETKLSAKIKNKIKFNNMEEFLPLFLQVSSQTLLTVPFTYPGFIKSKYCDIMSTGLAIEIADLKYSDNVAKINKFVRSPNWLFFVNACNQYGFMIDMHRPWRIVADLDSTFMTQLATTMGYAGGTGSLYALYKPAFMDTLEEFPTLITRMYQSLKRKNYAVKEICHDGAIVNKIITPETYTPIKTIFQFNVQFLAFYYLLLRLLETRPPMHLEQIDHLIKDTLSAQFSGHGNGQISMFEEIISKTFDKVGSYGYYRTMIEKSLEALRERYPNISAPADARTILDQGGGY